MALPCGPRTASRRHSPPDGTRQRPTRVRVSVGGTRMRGPWSPARTGSPFGILYRCANVRDVSRSFSSRGRRTFSERAYTFERSYSGTVNVTVSTVRGRPVVGVQPAEIFDLVLARRHAGHVDRVVVARVRPPPGQVVDVTCRCPTRGDAWAAPPRTRVRCARSPLATGPRRRPGPAHRESGDPRSAWVRAHP